MPWYIAVPGGMAVAVSAWFALLPSWMGRPAVKQRIQEAFAREHAARAAERPLEEVSR